MNQLQSKKISELQKKSLQKLRRLNDLEEGNLEKYESRLRKEKKIKLNALERKQELFYLHLNLLESDVSKIKSYLSKEEIEYFNQSKYEDEQQSNRKIFPKIDRLANYKENDKKNMKNTDQEIKQNNSHGTKNGINSYYSKIDKDFETRDSIQLEYMKFLQKSSTFKSKEDLDDIIYLESCYRSLLECNNQIKELKNKKTFSCHNLSMPYSNRFLLSRMKYRKLFDYEYLNKSDYIFSVLYNIKKI